MNGMSAQQQKLLEARSAEALRVSQTMNRMNTHPQPTYSAPLPNKAPTKKAKQQPAHAGPPFGSGGGAGQKDPSGYDTTGKGEDDADGGFGDGLDDYAYADVSTAVLEALGLRKHPDPVAECASLSSIQAPTPTMIQVVLADVESWVACVHHMCVCTVSSTPAPQNPSMHANTDGISALQFEAVRLACHRHTQTLPNGSRAGFFLGDGPGVGKGRQVGAMILENFMQGRKKAVWFSASSDLCVDAERDLQDVGALGYEEVRLHDLKKLKASAVISSMPDSETGVLFCTYDLLVGGMQRAKLRTPRGTKSHRFSVADAVSPAELDMAEVDGMQPIVPEAEDDKPDEFGEGSRLMQIIDWLGNDFDGLIVSGHVKKCGSSKVSATGPGSLHQADQFHVCPLAAQVFDECHRAKNCLTTAKKLKENEAEQGTKTARAVLELQRRYDARNMACCVFPEATSRNRQHHDH
eukprot:366336-Chlamydomonas_euryale.AAC.19